MVGREGVRWDVLGRAKHMWKATILGLVVTSALVGCSDDAGDGDDDADAGAGDGGTQSGGQGGSSGGLPSAGKGGAGGGSAGAMPGSGANWSALPAGDGARADQLKTECEAQCQRDGGCGFWDANECIARCHDPRELCQADLAPDACWTAWSSYRACVATLDCTDLNHFYYMASTADRPCTPEVSALEEACGFIELVASRECYGPNFTCSDGSSISPYWVCDGDGDCPDRGDEANCPWITEGPMSTCLPSATIDGDDSAGDVAKLAGVTCIDGPLYVRSSTLTDLSGLESLTSVSELWIGGTPPQSFDPLGNPALVSLKGLENLKGVSYLTIEGNPVLTDLTALRGLTFVTADVDIKENAALESLEGLDKIETMGELTIDDNPKLKDLKGLRSLQNCDGLNLDRNALIKDLSGLEAMQYFGALGAYFVGNPALVDFTGASSLRSIGATFYVYGNNALTSFKGLEKVELLAWTVTIKSNPLLASISELESLTEIRSDVSIEDNPLLPTCDIEAVLEPLGVTCTCSGNSTAACSE